MAASLLLKHLRFIAISSIKETIVIFCMGYMTYSVGELLHVSGIICLLACGITMAHYAWYNLSPQGKTISSANIQIIGFTLEAAVFAYLGLSFFSVIDMDWSWQFILVETAICIFARFLGTFCFLYLTALCRHKRQVTLKQLLFIWYGGLIRGAIAFGLVLRLDDTLVEKEHLPVITTTALTLVVTSTFVFGSTM